MALKKNLIYLLFITSLIIVSLLINSAWKWYQINLYNSAITKNDYIEAEKYDGEYGQFASAFVKQKKEDYQGALILYASLETTANEQLRKDVLFNSGNTYLQQAAKLDFERDAEQVFPLIELAKASYRRVLKIDSQYFKAKYNLERALQILPDADEKQDITVKGFERLVRAVVSAANEDELP